MIIVLAHRLLPHNQWCVLRCAHPGGRITTLCRDAIDYTPICVATVDLSDHDSRLPHNTCPACRTEIAAGTPGAAQAVEPGLGEAQRECADSAPGPDSAAIASALDEQEDLLEVPVAGERGL